MTVKAGAAVAIDAGPRPDRAPALVADDAAVQLDRLRRARGAVAELAVPAPGSPARTSSVVANTGAIAAANLTGSAGGAADR